MHKRWSIICNVKKSIGQTWGRGEQRGVGYDSLIFREPLYDQFYIISIFLDRWAVYFFEKTISNVLIIGSYLELSAKVACQKNGTNFANYYVPRIGPLAKIWAPLPRTYGHIFWTHFFNLYDGLLRPGLKTRNRVQVVTSYSTTIFNITKKKFHVYNDNTKNQTFDMNMFTICLRVVALSFK